MTRLLIHRRFLFSLTFVVAGLAVFTILEQFLYLANDGGIHNIQEFLLAEASLSMVYMGLGVLLDGRQVLITWMSKQYNTCVHEDDALLNHLCEYCGLVLISVGLLIEVVDQAVKFVDQHDALVMLAQYGLNLPLNIYGLYLLALIMHKLLMTRASDATDSQLQPIVQTTPR